MELDYQFGSGRCSGRSLVSQLLGLFAQLFEARVLGKGDGRHNDLLSSPAVRVVRLKGGATASDQCAQVNSALPADRGRPARLVSRLLVGAPLIKRYR